MSITRDVSGLDPFPAHANRLTMTDDGNTLLIIDDDANVRKSVVAYMEDSGFTVLEAENGQQGLAIYEEKSPDLIICDLRMPVLGGLSVLKSVASDTLKTPVIVVSGAGVMSDVVEALRLGASDYFIKPVQDLELLEMAVRRSLEQARLRQENKQYRHELELANLDLKTNLSVLQQDQQAGRYVQLKMLPETPKIINGYEFCHKIIPSLYLSGDFVEYVTVGANHITFFMADVSGHGASSAFVTVLLKNLAARLRSRYTHTGEDTILSPAKILDKANKELLSLDLGKYVTMLVGVLDTQNNTLLYSIAAHMPLPILSTGKEAFYLKGKGKPVGLFADAEYEEYSFDLPESFSLALFSDGILEILPRTTLEEKEAYLLDLFHDSLLPLGAVSAKLQLNEVKDAPDDIAVMIVSRTEGNAGR